MLATRIKVWRDRKWPSGVIAFCVLAELFCVAGYVSGYFDREPGGRLEWHEFQWDQATIAYTVALWLIWVCGVVVSRYYKERPFVWRARVMVSLPIVVFLFLAFGLVQLGPR